jgi:UDP-N-acetylmuramate--alanine ligase
MGQLEAGLQQKQSVFQYGTVGGERTASVQGKKFHFIGIGGIGMSGLAKLLVKHKAIVSGSDQTPTEVTEKLSKGGATIKIGHTGNNVPEKLDAVVISAAIKEDNPELQAAYRKGFRVYKYAQMLGELMDYYKGVAISGTHGKSTTTGWLVHCMKQAGVDVNFIVGADIAALKASSGSGSSDYFVAEACEYDRSFLNLHPKIACITNIEADHLDYYKDLDEIIETFGDFAGGVKKGGMVIINGHDSNAAKAVSQLEGIPVLRFGLDSSFDFYATNIAIVDRQTVFDVYNAGKFLGRAKILLSGKHNIMNALAVVAMAVNCGLNGQSVVESLGSFTGMDRRLMLKAQIDGVTVLDDYAHHPTEIKASLEAIKQKWIPNRIWCIFQPHQYSRTRFLLEDFAESFKLADVTIVPEIYFVRDSAESKEIINAEILAKKIKSKGSEAVFINSFKGITEYLKKNVEAGDLVVTMGAGDVWKVADEYIQWLRSNR